MHACDLDCLLLNVFELLDFNPYVRPIIVTMQTNNRTNKDQTDNVTVPNNAVLEQDSATLLLQQHSLCEQQSASSDIAKQALHAEVAHKSGKLESSSIASNCQTLRDQALASVQDSLSSEASSRKPISTVFRSGQIVEGHKSSFTDIVDYSPDRSPTKTWNIEGDRDHCNKLRYSTLLFIKQGMYYILYIWCKKLDYATHKRGARNGMLTTIPSKYTE
ncbi:unnamed protein product [Gongylonema pulchrum]|uniref:Uncharacterized protein n=1 Tax=Gongylonema pulchrum TaxID=637853 RepID=A0A183EA76_9BILA|nr:unnamed protein product [Gongylonema pulchrum]